MLSDSTKNKPITLDKASFNDNSKEIPLSDEFENFSNFSKNLKINKTQADFSTSGDESGREKSNSTQILQENQEQTTRNFANHLNYIYDEPTAEKS